MFSSSVPRLAFTVSPIPAISTLTSLLPRASISKALPSRHQRRASSSKSSSPANGSKGILATNRSVASNPSESSKVADGSKNGKPRPIKKKAKDVASNNTKGRDHAMLHLPSVPSTQHLTSKQLGPAVFFSLHRPIAITNGFPKPVTNEEFAGIFEATLKNYKPQEVISSLSVALYNLDTAAEELITLESSQDFWNETDEIRAGITEDSYRIDEHQHVGEFKEPATMQPISYRYVPFQAPPPPQPWDTIENHAGTRLAAVQAEEASFKSVLKMQEGRVHDRSVHRRQDMYAISVKRQRKLKMKKHKYKKLMRRTRNLRRRLDRN